MHLKDMHLSCRTFELIWRRTKTKPRRCACSHQAPPQIIDLVVPCRCVPSLYCFVLRLASCYVISNIRKDVADRKVIAHDAKGLKAKDGLIFTELETWKQKHPGKTPLSNMVDSQEVFQEDGSMAWKEGVWEKEGEAGVHRFERYRDRQIRTEETEDDWTCILSADQQEKKVANAFKSFNVKAFTLDDIEALPMDDEQKEEIQEEAEDVDSSEVDSDAAEALESREYTSLFDR